MPLNCLPPSHVGKIALVSGPTWRGLGNKAIWDKVPVHTLIGELTVHITVKSVYLCLTRYRKTRVSQVVHVSLTLPACWALRVLFHDTSGSVRPASLTKLLVYWCITKIWHYKNSFKKKKNIKNTTMDLRLASPRSLLMFPVGQPQSLPDACPAQ